MLIGKLSGSANCTATCGTVGWAMELFSRRRWRLYQPKWKAVEFVTKPKQLGMLGSIQYLFDFWADPFVHLLLLKSSTAELLTCPIWDAYYGRIILLIIINCMRTITDVTGNVIKNLKSKLSTVTWEMVTAKLAERLLLIPVSI